MCSRRSFTHPATAAFLLVALLSGCFLSPLYDTAKTVNQKYAADTGLRVRSQNGSISVQRSNRDDVQIIARIRAVSQERADGVNIVAERTEDGTLSIETQWPDNRRQGREGCSFEILIPDATSLDLQTSNGKLNASGFSGMAELHTNNGAIELNSHDGPVVAETSNGSVTLDHVWGPVDARSKNGKIRVVEAADAVSARTSNGSVRVTLASTSLGPVDVQTSNGAIELALGPVFAGQLLLKTSNGSINVDDEVLAEVISRSKRQTRLAFGDSDQQSKATTSNGAIRVRYSQQPGSSDPEQGPGRVSDGDRPGSEI